MITVAPADAAGVRWASRHITAGHYLHTMPDARTSPLVYLVQLGETSIGALVVGRPESTRCYRGGLTYGSVVDVQAGRAEYSRWSVLNLARVWLHPDVQCSGPLYRPELLPGYTDRRGHWRSTVASTAIQLLLGRVNADYLIARPPVFLEQPYAIQVLLSYCDTRQHQGTIYRAAGFVPMRCNRNGLVTYATRSVAPLTAEQDAAIRQLAATSPRSQAIRARTAVQPVQLAF